jgi:hypothetical protein
MTKGKLWIWIVAMCAAWMPTALHAQITVAFYSHDLGSTFPHAFFTVEGKTSDGRVLDTNFGFTAKSVSPAILMGSVVGRIETSKPSYVQGSDRQFAVKITDTQYAALMAHVEKWRTLPGKSYNLNKQNCIHFVGEAAALLGLKVIFQQNLLKKPKSFLLYVKSLNPWLNQSAAQSVAK